MSAAEPTTGVRGGGSRVGAPPQDRAGGPIPPGTTSASFSSLRMEGVSRWYGRSPALLDLDLELSNGEFVALLGPSGCGKSTALACMAGLQPLTTGAIWRDSTRIDMLPPERRGFGMVFQNYALFPHMSAQRNVEFGPRMQGAGRAERARKAAEALELVQLGDYASKLPSQLSGGQQQRVAIARALAVEPEVVLMDEPLSNLDAALRVELRTEIKRLYQERGLSVLYVTHDQEEALSLATRLVVLRAGRLEQTGRPEEVYTNPASAYVAGFMGYRNLFSGQVSGAGHASPRGRTAGVVVDGTRLTGLLRGGAATSAPGAPGDPVSVAIRPEDVVVGSRGGRGNELDAVAEVVEYHGRELAVQARTAGGSVLHVRTDQHVGAGEQLTLRIDPERVLVFPGAGAGAPGGEEVGRGDDH
nr:ABC transporter ATP-binding protein [uncultured Pseudokineococcus sp.]